MPPSAGTNATGHWRRSTCDHPARYRRADRFGARAGALRRPARIPPALSLGPECWWASRARVRSSPRFRRGLPRPVCRANRLPPISERPMIEHVYRRTVQRLCCSKGKAAAARRNSTPLPDGEVEHVTGIWRTSRSHFLLRALVLDKRCTVLLKNLDQRHCTFAIVPVPFTVFVGLFFGQ